nr:Gag-Pol polyprotein [Tanacetum cinerariifolium]
FLGTVKFGNDHVAKIMGYGDYQIGNASKTKSWLWHRCLSHLNFGAINHLVSQGIVRGLPKLKFKKDHLCSVCAMGKSTKKSHKPKSEDTNQEKLYLLHMDLCGPMHVESVNGKKYILVIVDDYSRFTWVKFLRSKDETPMFIIKFLKMIQVRLNVPVQHIRTDNGTEFVNQKLRDYYEEVTTMASEQSSSGPVLQEMTPGTISLGLVQKPLSSTSYVPPSRNDWDLLFQSLFDEILNPPPSVDNQDAKVIAPIAEKLILDNRVALVSSASGSPSKDNTKNNRIRRTLKKAKETELEDHPRKVKSSLNKASVVDSRANSSVIKSVSNVNSNLKCASCNGCLFSDNYDKCVVEYINSVNASRKSKSAKKPLNRKVWKTTGKVFKNIRYKWKPTGRTFT